MNAPFIVAQAVTAGQGTSQATSRTTVKLTKPANGQAVSVQLDANTQLDFSAIAGDQITLVRVGNQLVILFDNQATLTLAPFFDANGNPLDNLAIDLGSRVVDGQEFAGLFPITTDQSILPASGSAGGGGDGFGAGDPSVDALGSGDPLDLLAGEDGTPITFSINEVLGRDNDNDNETGPIDPAPTAFSQTVTIDEDGDGSAGVPVFPPFLADAVPGGPGDDPDAQLVYIGGAATGTQPLFDFGPDGPAAVDPVVFDLTALNALGLTSGGELVIFAYNGSPDSIIATTASGDPVLLAGADPLTGNFGVGILRPLDHPEPSDGVAFENEIVLEFPFTLTDGNGTQTTGTLTVNVDDDSPDPCNPIPGFVEEGVSPLLVTIDLDLEWGADNFNPTGDEGPSLAAIGQGDRSITFASTTAGDNVVARDVDGNLLPGLTSNGEPILYTILPPAFPGALVYLVAYVEQSPGIAPTIPTDPSVVFWVSLSDLNRGDAAFELRGPLDHPAPSSTPVTMPDGSIEFPHAIDLSFLFTAFDSDGDGVSGGFTVRVDAAGIIRPSLCGCWSEVDYSGLTGGVFINLSDGERTVGTEVADARTAQDREGVTPVIGKDQLGIDVLDAIGTDSDDIIIGGAEDNTLEGLGGDDLIRGGDGMDWIEGGAGADDLRGGRGSDFIEGDDGDDIIRGGRGDDFIFGDDLSGAGAGGDDTIYGGRGDDVIDGGVGDDTIRGGRGDDDIFGGAGDDIIRGGRGDDYIEGNGGDDTIIYNVGDGADLVFGGGGDDDVQEIYGTGDSETFNVNRINLGGDNFVGINIRDGIDIPDDVRPATVDNFEVATRGVEDIYIDTGAGADNVFIIGSLGGTGLSTSTITIEGGSGDATDIVDASLMASNHGVTFYGRGGDDYFFVGSAAGTTTFAGGTGTDTIDFSFICGCSGGIEIDLSLNVLQDTNYGLLLVDSVENVSGSGEADVITGNASANILAGGFGDDTITGGAGDDFIFGDEGDDTIIYNVGAGVDVVEGGEGDELAGDTLEINLGGTDDYVRISPDLDSDPTTLDIDIDANSLVENPADGIELSVTDVEEIVVNTGAGADNVVISGDLGSTGVATSTVTVNLGDGNDIVTLDPTQGNAINAMIDGGDGNDTVDASAREFRPAIGQDFLVSTTLAATTSGPNSSAHPQVTVLADGSFAVAWGGGPNPRGQVFATDGTPVDNTEFLLPSGSRITALADGGFVAVFTSIVNSPGTDFDIRAQVFAADGTPIGSDFQVSTTDVSQEINPQVTALANGGFAFTWRSAEFDGDHVRGRVFGADGTPVNASDFDVIPNTPPDVYTQEHQSITALVDGGFVVTWLTASGYDLIWDFRGRIFAADGTPMSGDFQIYPDVVGEPQTTALPDGGFVVTWRNSGVFAEVFAADGTSISGDVQVATGGVVNQQITALASGGFAMTWQSGTSSTYDIHGRVFAADGTPLGGAFAVSTVNANTQSNAQITALPDGGFVVTWQSGTTANFDIRGRVFAADGTPVDGSDFLISTTNTNAQILPDIAALPDGGFAVTWQSREGTGYVIRGRVFDAFGVENALTFDGGAGDDVFRSGAGNDIFNGGDDNDTAYYRVGDGRDIVDGGTGDDLQNIAGTSANETFNVNLVTLSGVDHVGVNIETGNGASSAVQATDTNYEVATVGVEDIFIDTGAGNDVVIVTGSLNGTGLAQSTITVDTGAGNDTLDLRGRDSAHRVVSDGKGGTDTVLYDFTRASVTSVTEIYATDGVTVIGAAITHTIGGVSVTDEFTNFESFTFTDGTYDLTTVFNLAPVAGDDTIADTAEDTQFTIAESTLLGNDSDHENDPITLTSVQGAIGGSVSVSGGNITFVPTANYFGAASFTYTIQDSLGLTDTATVTFNIYNVNDAPVIAGDLEATVAEGGSVVITTADLGEADLDDAGAGLTYNVTSPANGQVLVNGNVATSFTAQDVIDGRVSFRHDGSETTSASFTFTLADGGENGSTPVSGTFNLTVTPVNDSPVIAGDLASTVARGASVVITTGVLGEADPDDAGAELTYTVTSLTNGDVLVNGAVANTFTAQDVLDGRVRFQHDGSAGTGASFGFTLADGGEDGSTPVSGTFNLAVNEPPVAVDDHFTIVEDGALGIWPLDVSLLWNDSDPEGNPFQVISAQDPQNGTVWFDGDYIQFAPTANFFGTASFTYQIQDAFGGTDTATVYIHVSAINDSPALDLDSTADGFDTTAVATVSGGPVKITSPNVSIGDIDSTEINHARIWIMNPQSGDQLGVDGLPAGFVATLAPDGSLDIRHSSGPRSFAEYEAALEAITFSATTGNVTTERTIAVQIADPAGGTTTCGSVVTVNSAPVDAVNDTLTEKTEDTPFTIAASTLTGNDASAVTFVSVQDASGGIVSLSGGNITFTPTANYFGAASFTYTIEDSFGARDTATVSFNINNVNDAPVLDLDANDSTFGGNASLVFYTPNTPGVRVTDTDVSVTDDDANMVSANISLVNARGGDALSVSGVLPGGITASITNGGTSVTLSGSASRADYETAIEAITFSSSNASTVQRSLSVTIVDANGGGAGATALININTAPTITSAAQTTNIFEDGNGTLTGGNLVANPGFETYSQASLNWSNWTHNGLVFRDTSGHTGAAVVFANGGAISQTIDTVAGATYRLDYWYDAYSAANHTLHVSWNGAEVQTITSQSGPYESFFVQVVGTGSPVVLRFSVDANNGAEIDDLDLRLISYPAQQTANGTVTFSDVNGSDTHSASFAPQGANYVGTFALNAVDQNANSLVWGFAADNSALQFLRGGQMITQKYDVTVSDGHGGNAVQTVTVQLFGVNDPVVITSNNGDPLSVSAAENQTAVTTIATSDMDVGDTYTWSLSGTDAALFNISNAGVITFKNAPNFESSADAGTNNVYDLIVNVSDGTVADTQAVTVTVTDVSEATPNTAPVLSAISDRTVEDQLASQNYGLNNGTHSWAGNWTESDIGGTSATSGDIQVVSDSGGFSLRLRDSDNADNSITRIVDLSGAGSAELRFNYRKEGLDGETGTDFNDDVFIQISTDGVNFQQIGFVGYNNSSGYLERVADISGYISGQTYIRFVASAGLDVDATLDTVFLDNIKITYTLPGLSPVLEDTLAPVNGVAAGDAVARLVDLAGGGGLNNVTDSAGALTGIALTAVDTSHGTWWFSIDNGGTWSAVGSVSDAEALLLSADARLYFQPTADWSGVITDAITFRAWDQTSGTNGTEQDASINGGTAAFSTATDTADIAVASVNEPGSDFVITNVGAAAVYIPEAFLTENDLDLFGFRPFDVTAVGGAVGGTVDFDGSIVTFTDDATRSGLFTYVATDAPAPATVTITNVDASTLTGGNVGELMFGGSGDDLIIANGGRDYVYGNDGNDVIRGGAGSDKLYGGAGIDMLDLSDAVQRTGDVTFDGVTIDFRQSATISIFDQLQWSGIGRDEYYEMEGVIGSSNEDLIVGVGTANDIFWGGAGNDTIFGRNGDDIIRGGIGNEVDEFGVFNDMLDGEGGIDLLDLSEASGALNFTLEQGANKFFDFTSVGLGVDRYANFEGVIGSAYGDNLTGSGLADILRGGAGNDTLRGGLGNDQLTGGAGADTHVFAELGAANRDAILDYSFADGDKLDLSALLDANFGSGAPGSNTVSNFVRVLDSGNDATVQVDVDGAGSASTWTDVATLTNYGNVGNQVLVNFEQQTQQLQVA